MIPPTSVLHGENLVKSLQIAVLPATGTVMLNGLLSTMISLPPALTMGSKDLVTFSEQHVLETASPPVTSYVTNSIGPIFGTHEVIIIAITVSIGLVCAASLFAAVVKYNGYRRTPDRQTMSTTRTTKSSLEICCIGIESENIILPTENTPQTLRNECFYGRKE